jgi:hypothetical protein
MPRQNASLSDVHRHLPVGIKPATILALVAEWPGAAPFASGSAIAISDHFALTARHLIEDFAEHSGGRELRLSAASAISANHQDREWVVNQVVTSPSTEIALLFLGDLGAPIKMSGGPVYDESGRLVGVIATGTGEDPDDATATVSSVWTSLLLGLSNLDTSREGGFPHFLYDLAIRAEVLTLGMQCLDPRHGEDGSLSLSLLAL